MKRIERLQLPEKHTYPGIFLLEKGLGWIASHDHRVKRHSPLEHIFYNSEFRSAAALKLIELIVICRHPRGNPNTLLPLVVRTLQIHSHEKLPTRIGKNKPLLE